MEWTAKKKKKKKKCKKTSGKVSDAQRWRLFVSLLTFDRMQWNKKCMQRMSRMFKHQPEQFKQADRFVFLSNLAD